MPSTWKTFANGELLTASDVNNALNPSTADHIARAVHIQNVTVSVSGSRFGEAVVTWPAGRFTNTPYALASVTGTAGDVSAVARVTVASATSGTVRVGLPVSGSGTFVVTILALQA